MEANEVVIIIGGVSALVVAVAGVFLKYLANITQQDRAERLATAKLYNKSLTLLSESLKKNTESNRRIADEAKERNGHLAEIMIDAKNTAIKVATANREVYQKGFDELKCQKVKTQVVNEQIVEHIKE
jgi:uncharacterized membrane protein